MAGGGRTTRQWMLWAFKLHGCSKCGKRYPDLPLSELHCHHVDPMLKSATRPRGMMAAAGLLEIDQNDVLLSELVHCVVLCADCHKDLHRNGHDNGHVQEALFNGTGEAWRL